MMIIMMKEQLGLKNPTQTPSDTSKVNHNLMYLPPPYAQVALGFCQLFE